jgi:hypothetical protein
MKKFMVLYMAPTSVLEEWMKQPEEVRKPLEAKMQADWGVWMVAHKAMLSGITAGVGKTKRITADGVADVKNDIMLYSIAEAETAEAVAEAFKQHPHFGIPGATIEVMPINPLPGMNGVQ